MVRSAIVDQTEKFFGDPEIDEVLAQGNFTAAIGSVFGNGLYDQDRQSALERCSPEERKSGIASYVLRLVRRDRGDQNL
jgi:hypothetical protein